jgi:hypothetical protein
MYKLFAAGAHNEGGYLSNLKPTGGFEAGALG